MGKDSKIAWTEGTWNPWFGCIEVSPGCDNCYAHVWADRSGKPWEFTRAKPGTFTAPKRWAEPRIIFTCSLSDFFASEADAWRSEAWDIIRATPQHTYQILTKRPWNIRSRLPEDWGDGWPNVWLGVTAEDQSRADFRLPALRSIPAVVRFVSYEPAIGPVDWDKFPGLEGIDWVIVGGESGPGARPFNMTWALRSIDQCKASGTAVFVKQMGARVVSTLYRGARGELYPVDMPEYPVKFTDSKGDNPEEWPEELRVREFPGVQRA